MREQTAREALAVTAAQSQPSKNALFAETIPVRIEYYEFNGQPREEWPSWLQTFQSLGKNKEGRIATAYIDEGYGIGWWRWFDADQFWQMYRKIAP